MLEKLKKNMIECCDGSEATIAKIEDYIKTFDSFGTASVFAP